MSTKPSLYVIILLSITVAISPTISSVSGSTSDTTINNSSNYHTSDLSTSPSSAASEEKNNSTSTFEITSKLKALISDRLDKNKTNAAMVIGLVDPNGTQFYGHGKMSNTSNATVDENTVFPIGSITKVFTTTLLADMVNKGLVNLADPIENYLPSNVTVPQYNGHKITIEDLATHYSSLPEFPDNFCPDDPLTTANIDPVQYRKDFIDCAKDYTFDQFYQGLSNTTITREPGTKYEYSTLGISLLGDILTLKSNMSSFDELLKHSILDVLGMNDTSFNLSDSQKSRLAVGHFMGQELPALISPSPIAPGGALYSTASDMLKFLSANMGLIKTKLDDAMQESHLIRHSTSFLLPNNLQASDNNNIEHYTGLGWIVTTNFGYEVIWHNGALIGGYNSYMAFNPTTERGIVILLSTDKADIDITSISFSQNDELSSLIWSLLN
ncbi:MAG TPA: serine hydrolase domain-containing protein [Candidatus Saccharimonadales bacterium]|nr:serine hydrolase domain-containing protein [Candidatus Saccharimonadales bacterium]